MSTDHQLKRYTEIMLGNTDANSLILWRVNIPENEIHEIYEGINIKEKFKGEELTSNLKPIGQVFKGQPPSEHIHIIVELPATTVKRKMPTITHAPKTNTGLSRL
ncbi:12983_t:CDS:2, partial [Ambispora gerdemannii]